MKINLLVFMQDRTPVRVYYHTPVGVISVLTSSGKDDRINSDKKKTAPKLLNFDSFLSLFRATLGNQIETGIGSKIVEMRQ